MKMTVIVFMHDYFLNSVLKQQLVLLFDLGSPSPYYGQRPPSTGQRSSPPTAAQSSAYAIDQHNSSRQIIINDFYTSQQMQQPPPTHPPQQSPQNSVQQMSRVDPQKRNTTPGSVTPVYVLPPRHEVPYRQSPTPPTSHPVGRQGVIQRANAQSKSLIIVKDRRGRQIILE